MQFEGQSSRTREGEPVVYLAYLARVLLALDRREWTTNEDVLPADKAQAHSPEPTAWDRSHVDRGRLPQPGELWG